MYGCGLPYFQFYGDSYVGVQNIENYHLFQRQDLSFLPSFYTVNNEGFYQEQNDIYG